MKSGLEKHRKLLRHVDKLAKTSARFFLFHLIRRPWNQHQRTQQTMTEKNKKLSVSNDAENCRKMERKKHQIIRTSDSSKENNNKSGLGFFIFTSFNVFLSFVVHKINIYHSRYYLKLNYIHTWGSFCVNLTTLTRRHLSVRRRGWKMSGFRFYIKHSQSFRLSKHFLVYFHVLWLSFSVINSIIEPFLSFSIINTQFEGFSYSFWLSFISVLYTSVQENIINFLVNSCHSCIFICLMFLFLKISL